MKAATTPDGQTYYIAGFQSTPPVKAATLKIIEGLNDDGISIHAAREGGDRLGIGGLLFLDFISIHAAREGGDFTRLRKHRLFNHFNPRRP